MIGLIEFGNRTQSNCHKKVCNLTQSNVRLSLIGLDQVRSVLLGSIRFDLRMDVNLKTTVVKFIMVIELSGVQFGQKSYA